MPPEISLQKIDMMISDLKKTALELKAMADDFPALYRNSSRILASIKMLEMNASDLLEEEKNQE